MAHTRPQTHFEDLFEVPEGVEVVSAARAGLFPRELWKWHNHMVCPRQRANCTLIMADGPLIAC